MANVDHSNWMFEHSSVHQWDSHLDPHAFAPTDTSHAAQIDSVASTLKTFWHQSDLWSGGGSSPHGSNSSVTSNSAGIAKNAAPALTIADNALTVDAGGSVSLPISVTPASGHHPVSVTIAGLTSYETVTDNLDHKTFTGSSVTLTAAEVNSGLSLASNYTGTGHPVNPLTVTASETFYHHTLTSAPQTIVVTDPPVGSGSTGGGTTSGNPLTLQVSGDLFNGDPQIQVFVDGQQVGGTYDITAHHSQGQTQTIQIAGNFDPTVAHNVQVQFVNDAWDGTPNVDGHDRNVYVSSISLNGATIQGENFASNNASLGFGSLDPHAAVMLINGTTSYNVPADPPAGGTTSGNPLTLQVSGDLFNGDPQIQVFVDGHLGGTYDITAHHSQGQTQTIQIAGNFDPTVAHNVQVQFVNDAWDGTPNVDGHDRNVYVSSISLNGATIQGENFASNNASLGFGSLDPHAAVMLINGTTSYNVPADPPAGGTTAGGTTGGGTVAGTTGGGTTTPPPGPGPSTGPGPAPSGPGFFVSPNGNDSWAGDLAAPNAAGTDGPFATLARAQQAMENSGIKTTYVEGGTYNLTNTLTLTAADNGTTWAYYAPDGVNSAVLDGGDNVGTIIQINGGSNITIDGLKIQHFTTYGVHIEGGDAPYNLPVASGNTVENSDIGFNTVTSWNSGAVYAEGAVPHTTIKNNYAHDLGSQGLAINSFWNTSDSIDGSVIENNVVLRAVQRMNDGGAIYMEEFSGNQTSHVTIANNYVADYGAPGVWGQTGIYLDQGSNNVTVTGNVVGPPTEGSVGTGNAGAFGFQINMGHDDHVTGNILDLGDSGRVLTAEWFHESGFSYGNNSSGNTFAGNVVVSSFAGNQNTNFSGASGQSYYQNPDEPTSPTIQNNFYFNTAGGQLRTDGTIAGDNNPIFENPQLSGPTYQIASGSPVFNGPANFSPILGGWGPTGFVVPQTGTTQSG